MANFKIAFENTKRNEGGWTIDNGGETYQGISRKWHPEFKGWPLIDQWKKSNGTPRKNKPLDIPGMDAAIFDFYKNQYWEKMYGDNILNQDLANFVYDFAINSGSGFLIMNRVVGGRISELRITETTLKKFNEDPAGCYLRIRTARANYFKQLIDSSEKLKKDAGKGWIARLNKFPKTLYKKGAFQNIFSV